MPTTPRRWLTTMCAATCLFAGWAEAAPATVQAWEVMVAIDDRELSVPDIEKAIVLPIERLVDAVPNVVCIASSSSEGAARLVIATSGIDPVVASERVRSALMQLQPSLPASASPPRVSVQAPYSRLLPCFSASLFSGASR